MFTDRVVVKLHAGKGGNGIVAWRREKYIPKGGPFGGNGGKGGSIILEADSQLSSLEAYHYTREIKAENGGQGGANNCTGKNGIDLTLKVPCGTLVKNVATGEILCDLTESGQQHLICQGGIGGKGNIHFKSPTNRAPQQATKGELGEECQVEFELKLIADIGLVGFPNAGKSTLFSQLAQIEVKIAPYPFTTRFPNLGFIIQEDEKRIFLADIPGIISGAHQNRGLGFEFLRHIERTNFLLYVIDLSGMEERDPWEDFETLQREITLYNRDLLDKPFAIVLNKIDIESAQEHLSSFENKNYTLFPLSALTGEGIEEIVTFLKQEFSN